MKGGDCINFVIPDKKMLLAVDDLDLGSNLKLEIINPMFDHFKPRNWQ